MELSIFSAATALIAAAALTWLVLRFFFGTQKATAGAMDASGERQSATITVKGGYSPAVISMRTGTPITLTFDRQETGECTSHVVFADLGLDAMLPGNATTDVELPALPLRPKAITRAITNLIDNAWKYGGGEVTVKTAAVDGEIWLEIIDHGPGIPASETERLKRPFTRLETARTNASGTGLGLAIVERIARLHNGRLDLLPNPGGGLLARLVLPING